MHRIIHTSLLEIPTRAANQNRMAGTRSGLDHPQLFCMSDGSFVADLTTVLRVGRVVRCRPGCCRNCSRIIEEFVAALKTFIFQIVVDHLLFLIVSSSLSEPCMSHSTGQYPWIVATLTIATCLSFWYLHHRRVDNKLERKWNYERLLEP